MRQTLFHIPHEGFGGWPVFGLGWALLIWAVFSIALLLFLIWRQGWNVDTRSYLPLLLIVAAAIYFVLPALEERGGEEILGLPIRGYGAMVLIGVVCGVGLAVQEARREGIDPEAIFSLAFWMFLGGMLGARAFYIAQFWPQFHKVTLSDTILAMLKVTEGGLVVYGAVMGGLMAAIFYLLRRRLPLLAIGDLAAPSMLLGLAFGRIGCLLNGCCYGGLCEVESLAVRFPANSPPYLHQLSLGELHGVRLRADPVSKEVVVGHVAPDSPAALSGLQVGEAVREIDGAKIDSLETAQHVLADFPRSKLELTTADGKTRRWTIGRLPPRSLPVHPTQIYSAFNAAVLCFLLWSAYPFRWKDGQIFALMLTLYPITRFLLEWIRNDEPGRLGTSLTISQLVSLGILLLTGCLWWYISTQPKGVFAERGK